MGELEDPDMTDSVARAGHATRTTGITGEADWSSCERGSEDRYGSMRKVGHDP